MFDGSGAEFTARLERVGRTEVELAILCREEVNRELALELTLGAALPKGDRAKWLVEKAVELGVKRVVPLVTARAVARAGPLALARLRRTVIEASKQCGRNRLMEIAEPQGWPDFLAATQSTALRLVAQPEGQPSASKAAAARALSDSELSQSEAVHQGPYLPPGEGMGEGRLATDAAAAALAVGPEGGFTPDEVSMATAAGWRPVSLGPRILRTETAAILLTAIVVRTVDAT